jgi:hypothetical protein
LGHSAAFSRHGAGTSRAAPRNDNSNIRESDPMKIQMPRLLLAAALMFSTTFAAAQEARVYTEGAVTHVSYIKIKPGMFDAYMKYLDTDYKQLMDEAKKQGIILDYKVFQTTEAHVASDPDMVLFVVYKNMAALDSLYERMEPIMAKIMGARQKRADAAISREAMRDILGDRYIRELTLK